MRIFIILITMLLLACSDTEHAEIISNQGKPLASNASTEKSLPAVTADINTPVLSLPEEINHYARELAAIQNNPNAGEGVNGLWRLGRIASKTLTQTPADYGVDILERLSEEQYQEVINKMKGYFVNREEVIFAEPDPAFFLDHAKRSNDQASIEFFESYIKTKPDGIWAVYVRQQTDFSGCIRFGTMSLLDTYTLWDTYRNKFPSSYTDEINDILRDLDFALGIGTCACDSAKSAIEEFKTFIHTHPNAKLSSRLRERINQFNQGKSDIREQCHSG